MNEKFKDIPGFDGLYQVSNLGNVYNKKTGKLLKSSYEKKGYVRVSLNMKQYKVHRLVAITFIPNPENKPQVNHIDGTKDNNRIENLEWVTNTENAFHNVKIGKKGMCPKLVGQFDSIGNLIQKFNSCYEAEKITGFFRTSICNVANGKSKHTGGFIWKYL